MSSFHASARPDEARSADRAIAALHPSCTHPIHRLRSYGPNRGGIVAEPLEARRLAGGMITGLPTGEVAVGSPSTSDELVAGLLGDADAGRVASTLDTRAPLTSPPPLLAPADDPLSATGDPTPRTKAKPPTTMMLTCCGVDVYASVAVYQNSTVHEGPPLVGTEQTTGWFQFSVTSICNGSEDWPTSANVTWTISGAAEPGADFTGPITDGQVGVQLTNGQGTAIVPVYRRDDDLSEAPLEQFDVTLADVNTCGGTVLGHHLQAPLALQRYSRTTPREGPW